MGEGQSKGRLQRVANVGSDILMLTVQQEASKT